MFFGGGGTPGNVSEWEVRHRHNDVKEWHVKRRKNNTKSASKILEVLVEVLVIW